MPDMFAVTEGGIWDSDGKYVKGSSFREGLLLKGEGVNNEVTSIDMLADFLSLDLRHLEHKHEKAVYIGTLTGGWGHFITDSMRMLWFLRSRTYRENFSEYKLIYQSAQGFTPQFFAGNRRRVLEILGIDCSELIEITEPAVYDTVILPDECFYMSKDEVRHFTPEYVELIDVIREYAATNQRPLENTKKYYFSYLKYSKNKCIGEDKLEQYFASKGYQVIYPEQHSFDEQLNMLIHCESFASTVGSCAHNMIFLRDNTDVILIPRTNYIPEYQLAMDQVHKLKIRYVDSSFSIFCNTREGPFLYFVSSSLRKIFNDNDTEHIINIADFKKYIRMAVGIRFNRLFGVSLRVKDTKLYKYYSPIAPDYLGYINSHSWPCRFRKFLKKIKTIINKLYATSF